MKKIMFIFGVTLLLTACSNKPAEVTTEATDSTAVVVDTMAVDTMAVAVDTTKK